MSTRSRSVAGSIAPAPPPPPVPAEPAKRPKAPQDAINDFWAKFAVKTPSKATCVIPQNSYAEIVEKKNKKPSVTTTKASYEDAAAMCRAKVEKIVKECRRINKKYRDPHFDIEADLKLGIRDCLQALNNSKDEDCEVPGSDMRPQSVKRVGDIFDDPKFYIDGPTTNDVRQGRNGDCWLMAALCTLSNKQGLIEKLCVAHDQACGVYGFVFHRDGEWISEIVDDFLYLIKPDYDESYFDRILFEDVDHANPEEAYRKIYQSNSGSLYFAQCQDPQETWLPILEKAYAKAHGDYSVIEGGFGGEGIEDLTGGVTSEVWTSDILDKDYFWKEELLKVNEEFLFGCSTGVWGGWGERKGIIECHAYSVQKAVEIDGKRLLKLKNPWGKGEWNGPWSDGSKEWTPEWLQKLDHRFGDDGDFWIAYEDLLRKYQAFERTRLFGGDWRVTQTWTTLNVPWTLDYHDTHFSFKITEPGSVVIVLSQLDDRYFRGLEGQYRYELAFRVHKAGHEDYIVRSQTPYRMNRAVNVELELEAGEYEVRVKVDAARYEDILPIEEVIRKNAKDRRDKLIRIGLAYDLAHSKGKIIETPEEKKSREAYEKKQKDKKRGELKKKLLTTREEAHYLKIKTFHRDQKKLLKKKEKKKAKKAEKKARQEARKAAKAAEKTEEKGDTDDSEVKKEPEVKEETEETNLKDIPVKEAPESQDAETKPEDPKDPEPATKEEEVVTAVEEKKDDSTSAEETPSTGSDESQVAATSTEEVKPATEPSTEEGQVKSEEVTKEEPEEKPVDDKKGDSEESKDEAKDDTAETTAQTEEEKPEGQESDCESEDGDDLSSVGALSDLSDREIEIQINALQPPEETPATPVVEEEPDEFERDPWNAVTVVGLRIYYKPASEEKQGEVVSLNVIRPDPYIDEEEEEEDGKDGTKECKTKVLDVDDSAKDATMQGEVKDKKKSITGDGRKVAETS